MPESRSRKLLLVRNLLLLTILLCVIFLAAAVSFSIVRSRVLDNPGMQLTSLEIRPSQEPTPESTTSTSSTPTITEPIIPEILPSPEQESNNELTLQPWDGDGRVTILLLGLDYRDWESGRDYPRSDTMILLTLDPNTKTAGILSIPRDMWVAIPGYQHGKINTAYYLGEAHKVPGGGPGLATKTVEQFLGIPINYYAQIDFGAFVRFIDEIYGVEIDVPQKITIDLLGGDGVKTKKTLQPGRQVLPGEWALAYARARYTDDGDFDRARRQQQVIMAIRERMLSGEMLLTMIKKAPILYRELSSGIKTNLKLDDVLRLALAARNITDDKIKQGVLGKEYVIFGFSADNLSILVPIPDKIHRLRDEIFASQDSLNPATPGNVQQRMQAETARLGIYNASQTPGLAAQTAGYLKDQGANVVEVVDETEERFFTTTIIDHRGRPFTLRYLQEMFNNPYIKIYSRPDPQSSVDIEVYLGLDWARASQ